MAPPTVCLFHPAFNEVGGAEVVAVTHAQYLRQAGVSVGITTLSFDHVRWRDALQGVPVQVVEAPGFVERFRSPLSRLQQAALRAAPLLAGAHTVLATNFPTTALLSNVTARRLWWCNEPNRYLHMQGANPRLHRRSLEARTATTRAEHWYARNKTPPSAALVAFDIAQTQRLDGIYANSEFSRDNVRRIYTHANIDVIYPMMRFPQRPRRRSGLDRAGLHILTQTRLTSPKNVDSVLRGFAVFVAKQPSARLHVVGEGYERPLLEKLARRLNIASAVRFHGYLPTEQLHEVYEACDVFALLPLDEPFGMVFPEAAARGLLLVVPDHGGPLEIADGGALGSVCDPFDPAALATALEKIWAMTDAEVDARRDKADAACRDRYSVARLGPLLLRAVK